MRSTLSLRLPFLSLSVLLAACATGAGNGDSGVGTFDAGPDMDATMGECATDMDCADDGIFCNGGLVCVEGACQASAIPTCNDGIGCTRDECNTTTDMCENTPETSACPTGTVCQPGEGCIVAAACEFDSDCSGDGIFCNGDEVCVMGMCQSPMAGRECDDANSCTMDTCDETMGDCTAVEYPDILTNVEHCGTGADDCVVCPGVDPSLNQVSACVAGACEVTCAPGYGDVDGDMSNGCECMAAGMDDLPDMMFVDSNCDGIDGDVGIGVFVAPTFVGGNDANPGTMAMPVATIQRGIQIASTSGRARMEVYVSAGTYNESVALSNGVSIYGGYLATMGWARSDAYVSEIRGGETAVSGIGISMALEIQLMTIISADASTPGASSYGVRVANSTGVVRLEANTIRSGAGAAGNPGMDGTPGTAGSRGRDGHLGCDGCTRFDCASPPCNDGGASACAVGGRGGNGATEGAGGSNGDMGASGSASGVGGAGGTGGSGAGFCGTFLGDPGGAAPGPGGSPGADGANGATPTEAVGSTSMGRYSPASGIPGTAGSHGGGGGGGGGGAGGTSDLLCRTDRGGGGGGGGGAGCAGTPGAGGFGGGGSFGVFASSALIDAVDNTITVGNGGMGGRGGDGGDGGASGGGGTGGPGADDARPGGNGSAGGRGGNSGSGSGGPGGPSYGIFGVTAVVTSSGNAITVGTPGSGGAGGSAALGTAPTGLTGGSGPTYAM